MNRVLASALSALNIVLACGIVFVGIALGSTLGNGSMSGEALGLIGGLLVAGAFCGLVAFLTLIERHLRVLAEGRRETGRVRITDETTPLTSTRAEPTF